ncbi:hypothetical protein LINPERPRIM_LOCUS4210 [Linum perenne]
MTIAALHWPEKLHSQKNSNIARRYAKSDADDDTSDSDPVPAEEPPMKPMEPLTKPTEPPTKPTEPPTKTHIIRLRVRSSPTKPVHYEPVVFEASNYLDGIWKSCSYFSTKLQTPHKNYKS